MAVFASGASTGVFDLHAQRIGLTGSRLLGSNGVPIALAYGHQIPQAFVPLTASEWITVFDDGRDACFCPFGEVYAQNVDLWGVLGDPEPMTVDVRDVANDQGGSVRVSWNASWMDDVAAPAISEYRLWRSVPVTLSTPRTSDADEAARGGALLDGPFAVEGYAWEYVASQVAAQLPQYSLLAETAGDSTAGGSPPTAFMVEARATSGGGHWFSSPDSGHSVDNLAPPMPAPFAGQYQSTVTRLHWGVSGAPDLAGYRLYRGSTPGFAIGPSTLLAFTADTGYVDVAGAPYFYRLTAVDAHGNESPAAFLQPDGVLDAPGAGAARMTFLSPPYPSPTRRGATVRFGLAGDAPVSLTLHDAAGRLVRTIARGAHAAGPHAIVWDGRGEDGRSVAPGVYLVRLAAAGTERSSRLVVLE